MATTQVILRKKIEGLGAEADVVTVRAGYARNFLVPQGFAYEATRANKRHTEALLAARAAREAEEIKSAEVNATAIRRLTLRLELETGQGGKAFGSITNQDIANELSEQGIEIDRHKIQLESPIKTTGEHEVEIKLHHDVSATLRLIVKARAGEEAADEANA